MSRKIEQSVNVRDREPLGPVSDSYDPVASADLALLQHTEIKPRPMVRHQEGRDTRIVHAYPDAVARHAWLRHLEQRTADAIPVADGAGALRPLAFFGFVDHRKSDRTQGRSSTKLGLPT